MGWLKKKFRQLDRRVRKIFGKKAWLKVAAIIGGVYMGMGAFGRAGGGTGVGSYSTGSTLPSAARVSSARVAGSSSKLATFGTKLWNGIKNIFWKPAIRFYTGSINMGWSSSRKCSW